MNWGTPYPMPTGTPIGLFRCSNAWSGTWKGTPKRWTKFNWTWSRLRDSSSRPGRHAGPFHAGETRSYGWLAEQAGSPLAVRAAGQAMARNRWPLIIPCHRVIGSDGGLHGYGAGGLVVKARLLAMETEMERAAANDDGRSTEASV